MLAKSKKSAVIMACIFGVPVAVIAFVVGTLRYSALAAATPNPNLVNGYAGIGPTLMAGAVLLLSLGIAALVIYRLNDSHYGRQGATRWAVAGTIYGLLQQVTLTPIPADYDFSSASVLKSIGDDIGVKALTLAVSYALVFLLPSLIGRLRTKYRPDAGALSGNRE